MLEALLNARRPDAVLAREEARAATVAFEFRVFLGPSYDDLVPSDHLWNRTAPPALSAEARFVSWDAGLGIMEVTDASSFPSRGSVFVGSPSNRFAYTSRDDRRLYGVEVREATGREPDPDAIVRPYWEISENLVSEVEISGSFDRRIFVWSGELEIRGLGLIERDLSIVILRRRLTGDEFGRRIADWHLCASGWVLSSSFEDAYSEGDFQRIRFGGILERARAAETKPLVSRAINLVKNGQASATSTLSDLSLESGSDDFVAGTPTDVNPDKAIDGDINSLWISQGEPSALTWTQPQASGPVVLDEVYFRPPLGQGPEETWFRVVGTTPYPFAVENVICNDQTIFARDSRGELGPANYYLTTKGVRELQGREFKGRAVIFCKNLTVFRSKWDPGNELVLEWPRMPGPNARFFQLNEGTGWLLVKGLVWGNATIVCWGDGSGNPPSPNFPWSNLWRGPWVPLPARGHSIRTVIPWKNGGVASDWMEAAVPIPAGQPPETGMETTERLTIVLPEMGLTLGQDLAADPNDPPSKSIEVQRGGVPDTSLLADAGAVLIDQEIITYSGRTAEAITGIQRAAYGSQVAAHMAGTTVAAYEGGRAWTAPLLSRIVFRRPPERNPQVFAARLYVSTLASPRQPETPGWELDWEHVFTWTASPNLVWSHPGKRVRTIMLVIDQMASLIGWAKREVRGSESSIEIDAAPFFSKMPSTGYLWANSQRFRYTGKGTSSIQVVQPPAMAAGTPIYHLGGRARVNEVEAFPATRQVEAGPPVPSSDIADLIAYILTQRLGVNPNRIRKPPFHTPGPSEVYITQGAIFSILAELCETYRVSLIEYPDLSFAIATDFWSPDEEAAIEWTEDNVIRIEAERQTVSEVSQVIVRLRDPATQETRTFLHPPQPSGLGRRVELERSAPLSLGPWIAAEEYRDAVGRRSWLVEPAGPADRTWGGHRHRLKIGGEVDVRVVGLRLREGNRMDVSLELEEI